MDILHYLITGSFDSSNLSHLDDIVRSNSINFTLGATVLLFLLVAIAWFIKKQSGLVKSILFTAMILIISINTIYLTGATIYKNQRSVTKGPVHWHADFEIWNCGQKVNLLDPTGWSNKIGTPVYHEHNDDRLHVEGVVLDKSHVSLGEFFQVIDGEMTSRKLVAPINEGFLTLNNGDMCNGQPGMLQVFVYKTTGTTFRQEKLQNPEDYILSAQSNVPDGDCIIVEFDSMLKEKTDKMCTSYRAAEKLGKIKEEGK